MDPLLHAGEREDLQRLLKENRELREANASLRVAAESSARAAVKPRGGKERAAAASGASSESAVVESAASVRRLKEEAQRVRKELGEAQREGRQARDEYKQLKAVFEAFVVEVCEREEAYKVVFARAHEETAEQRGLVESLREQLRARSQEPPPRQDSDQHNGADKDGGKSGEAKGDGERAEGAVVVQGVDPTSLHDVVASLHDVLDDLAGRVGFSAGAKSADRSRRRLPTTRPPEKVTKQVLQASPLSSLSQQQQQQQQQQHPQQQQVIAPAPGAGALRAKAPSVASSGATAERRKRGRPPSAVSKTEPSQNQQNIKGQRRRRTADEPALHTGTADGRAAALFDVFASSAERPASHSVVNFGGEPVADYMRLLERTNASSVDVLRRELMRFCKDDPHVLADYAVEHFLTKALLAAPMVTLWKHTERIVLISGDIFSAFARAALRKLVQLLGPDSATELDHRPHLRTLALTLRMACAAHVRETGSVGDVVQQAFYECTVSALRRWRVATESAAAGTRVAHEVLAPWMVTAQHLCGFVEEFHMLMKYYANTERVLAALALPKSLSCYAAQAVMTQCFLAPHAPAITVDAEQCMQWAEFCDVMDWSRNALPCDALGAGAVRILAHTQSSPRRGEALLALRLFVLQRGIGFLQGLTEQLRAAGGEVDVDTIFAELFSVAVVDLQLSDPRDEQWGRAMAFFAEYLASASIAQAKSAEELLARCTDAHLLVMRAVLQLCCGGDTLSDEGAERLGDVLCWAKALRIALERAERDKDSEGTASHPLRSTELGRELLYLSQKEI